MSQPSLSLEEPVHLDVLVTVTQNATLYVVEPLSLSALQLSHQVSLLAHNSLVAELHVNRAALRVVVNKTPTKLYVF